MKKGRFLWSAHRITERQKAGKARSIKGKQLKNSRNTVSKLLVEHHSSQNVNFSYARDNLRNSDLRSNPCFTRVCGVVRCGEKRWNLLSSQRICNTFATKISKNIGHFSVIGTGECPFCYADFVSAVTLSSFSKVLLIASTRTCISK